MKSRDFCLQVEKKEADYRSGIEKELKGIMFSETLQDSEKQAEVSEEEEEEVVELNKERVRDGATEEDDEAAMAQMMMPRKTKKLYEAMKVNSHSFNFFHMS